jgi:hypothetical protein
MLVNNQIKEHMKMKNHHSDPHADERYALCHDAIAVIRPRAGYLLFRMCEAQFAFTDKVTTQRLTHF